MMKTYQEGVGAGPISRDRILVGLCKSVFWASMAMTITNYFKHCLVFQSTKPAQKTKQLQPYNPLEPFEAV